MYRTCRAILCKVSGLHNDMYVIQFACWLMPSKQNRKLLSLQHTITPIKKQMQKASLKRRTKAENTWMISAWSWGKIWAVAGTNFGMQSKKKSHFIIISCRYHLEAYGNDGKWKTGCAQKTEADIIWDFWILPGRLLRTTPWYPMSRLPVTARGKTWHRMAAIQITKSRNHHDHSASRRLSISRSQCVQLLCPSDLRWSAAPAASARPGAAQPARALARAFARDSRDSVAIARPPSPGELWPTPRRGTWPQHPQLCAARPPPAVGAEQWFPATGRLPWRPRSQPRQNDIECDTPWFQI